MGTKEADSGHSVLKLTITETCSHGDPLPLWRSSTTTPLCTGAPAPFPNSLVGTLKESVHTSPLQKSYSGAVFGNQA